MQDSKQPVPDTIDLADGLNAHEWRDNSHQLWQLLDDIDTLSDSMKPDINPFFERVMEIAHERHKILASDGYDLYPYANLPESFGSAAESALVARFWSFKMILDFMAKTLMRMENIKGDDRSATARHMAISITHMEDAFARWKTFVMDWERLSLEYELEEERRLQAGAADVVGPMTNGKMTGGQVFP